MHVDQGRHLFVGCSFPFKQDRGWQVVVLKGESEPWVLDRSLLSSMCRWQVLDACQQSFTPSFLSLCLLTITIHG